MANLEKIELKRRIILDALMRILDKYAYSYVSMQDVADEAGISKGGLRYYFPTKESLFIGLIQDFFEKIEEDHIGMINQPELDEDRFFLSTLFGIEQFVLNEKNIKIFVNLILYGLQDPKMMMPIQKFFRNHLNLYKKIITQTNRKSENRDAAPGQEEFDLEFLARITQVIFLSTGLLEAIDPIRMEPSKLARYVISLFDNK